MFYILQMLSEVIFPPYILVILEDAHVAIMYIMANH